MGQMSDRLKMDVILLLENTYLQPFWDRYRIRLAIDSKTTRHTDLQPIFDRLGTNSKHLSDRFNNVTLGAIDETMRYLLGTSS